MKRYTEEATAPLGWHKFYWYFFIPLDIIVTCVQIFPYIPLCDFSDFFVSVAMLYAILSIVLKVVAFIGFFNWRKYSWYAAIASFVLYYLYFGVLLYVVVYYDSFGAELSTSTNGFLLLFYGFMIVYYIKRKPLFFQSYDCILPGVESILFNSESASPTVESVVSSSEDLKVATVLHESVVDDVPSVSAVPKVEAVKEPNRFGLKRIIVLICTFLLCIALTVAFIVTYRLSYKYGSSEGYDNGYSEGYEIGYHDGDLSGYITGKTDGVKSGFDAGYDCGHSAGYDEGATKGSEELLESEFNRGYIVGYDNGKKFIDESYERKIKSAYNSGYDDGYDVGFEEGARSYADFIDRFYTVTEK